MNNDKDKDKKGLVYYVLVTMLIVFSIAPFILEFTNFSSFITLFIVASILIITDLIMPFCDYIKNEQEYTVLDTFFMWSKIISVILLSASIYYIYVDKSYNLFYSYVFVIITFLILLLIHGIETILAKYKKKKEEEGHISKLYFAMIPILSLLPLSIFLINLYANINFPKDGVNIQQVKKPETIAIYETDVNKNGKKTEFSLNDIIEIKNQEDISTVVQDLKQIQTKNYNTFELLNHYKMREDNHPYYRLSFWYDIGIKETFENGYIDYIVITSNRKAVIERIIFRENSNLLINLFTSYVKREVYPIELSEDAYEVIFTYLDK
jgi:F0F1-type ATP synthase assembly protein I